MAEAFFQFGYKAGTDAPPYTWHFEYNDDHNGCRVTGGWHASQREAVEEARGFQRLICEAIPDNPDFAPY